MRKMLLTMVLVLPLDGGAALAQETSAEEIGGALGGAIDEAASGIAEGVGSALDAAGDEMDVDAGLRFAREQLQSQFRGSRLIGAEVRSVEGDRIGEIVDLVFDRVTGAMSALVVALDGAEDRQVALDWEEMQVATDGITTSVSLADAEAAPDYEFLPE